MASIAQYLAQGLPSEQDYYAENPFLMGARGVSGWSVQPRTSSEAVWMPAVQGLMAGLLQGYGKKNADRESFKDTRSSPIIRSALQGIDPNMVPTAEQLAANPILKYLSEEMPEDFTIKQGRADQVMQLLQQENAQEQALKNAEVQAKFKNDLMAKGLMVDPEGGSIIPVPGFAEAEAQALGLKKAAENKANEVIPGVPAALQDEAVKEITVKANKTKGDEFVDEQFEIAKKIPSAKALFPGTTAANEIDGVAQALRTFIQKHLNREMNGPEQATFLASLPDWNDTKKQIDLKKARFKSLMTGTSPSTPILDAYKGQGNKTGATSSWGDAPVPTGEITKSGKKVYIVNGVKGTID